MCLKTYLLLWKAEFVELAELQEVRISGKEPVPQAFPKCPARADTWVGHVKHVYLERLARSFFS